MFQRILVEDWATYVPIISFFLISSVFTVVTIRALKIEKGERNRLASLPLEENSDNLKSP